MALTNAMPVALPQRNHRFALRPRADHKQSRLTLSQTGGQSGYRGIRSTARRPSHHDIDHVSNRCRYRQPLITRMRYQHESLKIDPKTLGRFNAELGHSNDSAPRSRCGWCGQKRHEEHRRAIDRVNAALLQAATREQRSYSGVRRDKFRAERARLHLTDACLQFSHTFCRRKIATACTYRPANSVTTRAVALRRQVFSGR